MFDLDGTLIDSKADIADALNWTLRQIGRDPLPIKTIEGFVGNGVAPLISRAVEASNASGQSLSEEKVRKLFRGRYWDHLLDKTKMFDHVEETIHSFVGRYKMGVISNKPQRFTKRIVEELGLRPAFGDQVYGGDTLSVKKPDPTALRRIIETYDATPERTVMVGDSKVDIETGKNAGAYTVGVKYGFRSIEELNAAQPDHIIDSFDQLNSLLP